MISASFGCKQKLAKLMLHIQAEVGNVLCYVRAPNVLCVPREQAEGGQAEVGKVLGVLRAQAEVGQADLSKVFRGLWAQAEVGKTDLGKVVRALRVQAEVGLADIGTNRSCIIFGNFDLLLQ